MITVVLVGLDGVVHLHTTYLVSKHRVYVDIRRLLLLISFSQKMISIPFLQGLLMYFYALIVMITRTSLSSAAAGQCTRLFMQRTTTWDG